MDGARSIGRGADRLRENVDLARRLDELEKRYDGQFRVVFEAIRQLMEPPPEQLPSRRIGFGEDPG